MRFRPVCVALLFLFVSNGWAQGTWSDILTPPLPAGPAIVRLLDGRLLFAGGTIPRGGPPPAGLYEDVAVSSVEIFDPASSRWMDTAAMHFARRSAQTSLLPDGRVLVVGGTDDSGTISTAEIYDPAAGVWSTSGSLIVAAVSGGEAPPPVVDTLLLPSGKVLVQHNAAGFSAELFDPVSETFQTIPTLAAMGSGGGYTSKMGLLADGRVLIAAGNLSSATPAEIYDPVSGALRSTTPMSLAPLVTSVRLLHDGRVLIRSAVPFSEHGGPPEYSPDDFVYDPQTDMALHETSTISGSELLLSNGKVLIAAARLFA